MELGAGLWLSMPISVRPTETRAEPKICLNIVSGLVVCVCVCVSRRLALMTVKAMLSNKRLNGADSARAAV